MDQNFYKLLLNDVVHKAKIWPYSITHVQSNEIMGVHQFTIHSKAIFGVIFVNTYVNIQCLHSNKFETQLHDPDALNKMARFIKKEFKTSDLYS